MTVIGIDPHKATRTAVAVDDYEVVLDEFKVRASTVQATELPNNLVRDKLVRRVPDRALSP